jgi:hypothetical protein
MLPITLCPKFFRYTLIVGFLWLALSGCGGGGGGNQDGGGSPTDPTPSTQSSQWDQMVWDQGKWK